MWFPNLVLAKGMDYAIQLFFLSFDDLKSYVAIIENVYTNMIDCLNSHANNGMALLVTAKSGSPTVDMGSHASLPKRINSLVFVLNGIGCMV